MCNAFTMALKGVKVIEFAGLAPGPFCGMLLSDFGATVLKIDKVPNNTTDVLSKGKRCLALNIKHKKAQEIVQKLCVQSDVLIDPYRPGILEKLNLGPDKLLILNPSLIYARLTGFGQTGPLSKRAGHDINYLAVSGMLSFLGRKNEKPFPPINIWADFAGGGLLCAFAICAALVERSKSGLGQVIDCSMVEGSAYLGSFLTRSQVDDVAIWGNKRGENVLDGGAYYYDTYETLDGKYMSVGALEPKFFEEFLKNLNMNPSTSGLDQISSGEEGTELLTKLFKTKTQKEWTDIFEHTDSCVYPVLEWDRAHQYSHNKYRNTFVDKSKSDGIVVPNPAPILNRTPAKSSVLNETVDYVKDVKNILNDIGYGSDDFGKLSKEGALILPYIDSKL